MAQANLTPLDINANKFIDIVATVNAVIDGMKSYVVTCNTDANGASTTGNGYVLGVFGATQLVTVNGIRGGTPQTSANLVIGSNVVINSVASCTLGSVVITNTSISTPNANIGLFTSGKLPIGNSVIAAQTYTVTNTSLQTIDFFDSTVFRSAEYTISMSDAQSNNFQLTKILLIQNAGNALVTEYGTVMTNTSLGTFSATTNSTSTLLQLTPATSNVYINLVRTALNV